MGAIPTDPIDWVLWTLANHAADADSKAGEAFGKSKFSAADYWLCVEFRLRDLHDAIARKFDRASRCPRFAYSHHINESRREWNEKGKGEREQEYPPEGQG